MNEGPNKIRITDDDLKGVKADAPWPGATPAQSAPGLPVPGSGGASPGLDRGRGGAPAADSAAGNFLLKSWVYLGLSGLAGAFIAWALCEPGFVDGDGASRWGNYLLFPFMVTAMSIAFAAVESLVERSTQKAIVRGLVALVLGIVLGYLFYLLANWLYRTGLMLLVRSDADMSIRSPARWIVRAIAWMAFGATGGIVYGIVGRSWKKCLYGTLGGILGAGIGGFCFDPINILTGSGGAGTSRCIGMIIFGASTGIAIGLVESALKNRWLYVSGGPLAGKQFILYKPVTRLGSNQANDIYLFKDLSIAPAHATIELRGPRAALVATGPTFVGGQPVTQRVLKSGDQIQIGRYTFQYQEKQAQG